MSCRLFLKVTVFVIGFLLPLTVTAQTEMEDVIYLKNGGILRGEIIEEVDNKILRIKTAGRNVLVVRLEEVEKITSEEIPGPEYFKTSGYVNYTGIDLLSGQEGTTVRFMTVNGYQFNPRLSVGVGVSFVPYNDPLGLIPVYIDSRYKFLKANTTSFVFIRMGYSLSVMSDEDIEVDRHRGGFMFNPGIGLQFNTNSKYGWYFTAGYNADNSNFEQDQGFGRTIVEEITYRRVQFGFGFSF